ncbi:MAG: hypothetical protein ACRD6W_15810 [Nitrososphaerales archaeon]
MFLEDRGREELEIICRRFMEAINPSCYPRFKLLGRRCKLIACPPDIDHPSVEPDNQEYQVAVLFEDIYSGNLDSVPGSALIFLDEVTPDSLLNAVHLQMVREIMES